MRDRRVAILGLGAMGSRMAENLIAQDYQVSLWTHSNKSAAQPLIECGAVLANTAKEAVNDVDCVIAMVRDDEASRRVWLAEEDGALAGLSSDAIAIDSSTLSPTWANELSQVFSKAQKQFIHAPVVGSRPQAEAGNLIYLLGGEASAVASANVFLKHLGSSFYHVGDSQTAAIFKLCINATLAVQVALLAELTGFVKRWQIPCNQFLNILTAMPTCSPAAKAAAQSMLDGNFAPLFPVELIEKDLAYLMASASDEAMPIGATARKVYSRAMEAGFGQEHLTAALKLYV